MRRPLLRFLTAVQLTRLSMAFGAVSDVWFVILITRTDAEYQHMPAFTLPTSVALLAAAVVAVGLFAYGAALNDVLDVRHDATFSPERPIPAGRIRPGQAVVITAGALIVAVLGSSGLGSWGLWLTLLAAAGILFYNATGRYIPAVGVVTIGLIHAVHMFIPNASLGFTLPVLLIMTHAMAIALAVHYLEDKRPRLGKRGVVAIVFGWASWATVVIAMGILREGELWPADVHLEGIIAPIVAVFGFCAVAWWKTSTVSGEVAAEKLIRYGAMWQALYAAAWLLGLGREGVAIWMAVFAVLGFAAMTLLKEMVGVTGRPIEYRG